MAKNFYKSLTKIFLLFTFFFILLLKVTIAETFTFSLSAKGIKFGSFYMIATESGNQYKISSNFESSGILGAFTKIKLSSGVYGQIKSVNDNIYYPIEVLSKWKSLLKQKQSKIKYKNKKIVHYEVLPYPRENKYALKINQLDNTIDPLTVTYLLLKKRKKINICKGEKLVSEGQTIMKIVFLKKEILQNKITCYGEFQFVKGFDPKKYKKKKYKFTSIYKKNNNHNQALDVTDFIFNTRIGEIIATRLSK